MSTQERRLYEFGPFLLDPEERLLLRDGKPVALTPKALETLIVLVKRSGHLVEKDFLLKEVWPGTFVEESNLSQNIFTLRKILGQSKDGQQYIETVPRHGFRFLACVTEARGEGPERRPEALNLEPTAANKNEATKQVLQQNIIPVSVATDERRSRKSFARQVLVILVAVSLLVGVAFALLSLWTARKNSQVVNSLASPLAIKSVAVLPFKSLSASSGDDYQGMAMADALITRLSNTGQLVVRHTSAVLKYADSQDPLAAGREQGVDAVLDGNIQRDADRVRVTVRLVRVNDGKPLWADRFDEKFTNIFMVQDAISERVAQGMMLKLTGEEKKQLTKRYTENSEAYQAYLRGRFFWSKRTVPGLRRGAEHFQQAIEIDPTFALAYAGLADSYILLGVYMALSPNDAFPKAKAAVEKALEIDDSVAEAHSSLGAIKLFYEWDWHGAEQQFKRASELNPSYAYARQWNGLNLCAQGRLEEAIAEMKRAQELDPLSLIINTNVGWAYYFARRHDQAIEQHRKTIEMDPNFARVHLRLGLAYMQKAMHREATTEYEKSLNLAGSDPYVMSLLGYAKAVSEHREEAVKVLTQLREMEKQRYVPPYSIALIYVGLGQKDEAFQWLENAFTDHSGAMIYLKVEPMLDSLRSDPRFADLLKRMHLN